MKTSVLTVWQPWASLLVAGLKPFEIRTWPTQFRGLLAIHAGAGQVPQWLRQPWALPPGFESFDELPRGAIIGTVNVIDCLYVPDYDFTDYERLVCNLTDDGEEKLYAWQVNQARRFAEPIHCRGNLGIWKKDLFRSGRQLR